MFSLLHCNGSHMLGLCSTWKLQGNKIWMNDGGFMGGFEHLGWHVVIARTEMYLNREQAIGIPRFIKLHCCSSELLFNIWWTVKMALKYFNKTSKIFLLVSRLVVKRQVAIAYGFFEKHFTKSMQLSLTTIFQPAASLRDKNPSKRYTSAMSFGRLCWGETGLALDQSKQSNRFGGPHTAQLQLGHGAATNSIISMFQQSGKHCRGQPVRP